MFRKTLDEARAVTTSSPASRVSRDDVRRAKSLLRRDQFFPTLSLSVKSMS